MDPFIGEIKIISWDFAPSGWSFCNGALLPINQNQALFALLGTTFGGDGIRTFALPELRSRVAIHQGAGAGLGTYVMGQKAGLESVALSTTQIPAHSHIVQSNSVAGDQATPVNNYWGKDVTAGSYKGYGSSPNSTMNAGVVSTVGSSTPHENRPPFLSMNLVIALVGIFPSRN